MRLAFQFLALYAFVAGVLLLCAVGTHWVWGLTHSIVAIGAGFTVVGGICYFISHCFKGEGL